jgi:outer membrane protein assembly factor BamE (lipoprotein component of BamABCDE complex)
MKHIPLLTALALLILSTSACSILKELVTKTGEAINAGVAVPENVATNTVGTVKSAFK